ncbi:Bug family tripartite tricarboxylate transporter substrate binding protein [Falsiroseomonas tokyonensis]|uniref:Bug family tripartite tricarboxylate transporter substrate binding protein n=1 Tax=Falsiroseomonas tokyonensis TaxID=430521 RepID=A0ABV7BPU1_9PROT|nr:tripartite tricarboxylate transporter substrate binding protein [Falsiroseomonas tokyonensis]MBU8537230.1 tripartite tricarboxylate transporter substrate binding protein [Falsiroseomonas tokyonensis]
MPIATITRRGLLAAGGSLGLLSSRARAADYPNQPIRLIVPFPPGGTVDVTARLVMGKVAELLGSAVIIDSAPGAGGNVGTQRVARATPDGYTLLFTAPNHTINPSLTPNSGFEPERDFAPISLVAQIAELLIAPRSAPFATFAEFVAYARANPGKLTYSSAGIGSHPHVTMELMLRRLGLEVLHVPYRGAAPAFTDLVAGRVQLKLDSLATSAASLAEGSIRALAIASRERSPKLPDVPTIAEMGLPGFEGILWMGVVAPTGTPPEAIATLSRALMAAARDPEVMARLDRAGVEPVGNTPEDFRALIAREIPLWRQVIRDANIRAE